MKAQLKAVPAAKKPKADKPLGKKRMDEIIGRKYTRPQLSPPQFQTEGCRINFWQQGMVWFKALEKVTKDSHFKK